MTTTVHNAPGKSDAGIRQAVTRRVFQVFGQVAVTAAMLLVAAGRIDWLWAWVFIGTQVVLLTGAFFVLVPGHAEVVAERSEIKAGTKGWDWIITLGLIIPSFALYVVAGLDDRFGWSADALGPAARGLGLAVLVAAYLMLYWAMMSNRFFTTTVRIQKERGHQVVSSGPYAHVRHPGYAAMICATIATSVLLGSTWALIPAALYAALMVVRAALEDRTLRAELEGYADYAQRVHYRLLPGVW